MVAAGALAGGGFAALAKPAPPHAPAPLRPPGAGTESVFLATCIRCGQCVTECPVDALALVVDGAWFGAHGTPAFDARNNPCTLCRGEARLRCVAACPSGALTEPSELRAIRIGTARIDTAQCFAYQGVTCRACWHACPLPGDALAFDDRLRPVVDPEHCVGCGLCEHACLTDPAAIVVHAPSCATSRGSAR